MINWEKSNTIERFENWKISAEGKLFGVRVGAIHGCLLGITVRSFMDDVAAFAISSIVIIVITKVIFEIVFRKMKNEKDQILYGDGGTEEDVP